MSDNSIPSAHAAGEHFDDNFIFLGVFPRNGDLVQLTAELGESVGGVRVGMRDRYNHAVECEETMRGY